MSNQLASSRFRSSSRPLSSGSRCPRSISSARRSTRNLTPSGSALNCAQQSDARRLQRVAQRALGRRRAGPARRPDQRSGNSGRPRRRSTSNSPASSRRKRSRPSGVERQISAAEIGGASACRDLAAAPVEAAQHLLAKPARIVAGKLGAGASRSAHRARTRRSRATRCARLVRVRSKTPSKKPAGAGSVMAALVPWMGSNETRELRRVNPKTTVSDGFRPIRVGEQ